MATVEAPSVDERLRELEAEVTKLKVQVRTIANGTGTWWNQIAGTFANDPMYEEAMRLARRYRESLRPKSRERKRKR
jgi:hypothetical protein